MVDLKKLVESLHGLILINNDRVKWYEKAITQVKDIEPSVVPLFEEFAEESRSYVRELDEKIKLIGTEDGIESTTLNGKMFRIWSDLKSSFSDNLIESVLSSSEHVEDRVQEAYTKALKDTGQLDEDSVSILEQQQMFLKDMHDKVKTYRDESKTD